MALFGIYLDTTTHSRHPTMPLCTSNYANVASKSDMCMHQETRKGGDNSSGGSIDTGSRTASIDQIG